MSNTIKANIGVGTIEEMPGIVIHVQELDTVTGEEKQIGVHLDHVAAIKFINDCAKELNKQLDDKLEYLQ